MFLCLRYILFAISYGFNIDKSNENWKFDHISYNFFQDRWNKCKAKRIVLIKIDLLEFNETFRDLEASNGYE